MKEFTYTIDNFADLKIMRYRVEHWDSLSLQQKSYIYHLVRAALYGRDILFDQNCGANLEIKHILERILQKTYLPDRHAADEKAARDTEFAGFLVYAKRFFFSNGIHHHYAEDKFLPECSREYFSQLMQECGYTPAEIDHVLPLIYDPEIYPQRKCTRDTDLLVENSGVSFYEGVSSAEAHDFYRKMEEDYEKVAPGEPVSFGLNSRLVKKDGKLQEKVCHVGGLYSAAIEKIVAELETALGFAENEQQKRYVGLLIEYYRTGDLKKWDEYSIEWLADHSSKVDFINGFIETYTDPLGYKGSWEALVNIKDEEASQRTVTLSKNAQWFEDHSPVNPAFRKPVVKGVTAKVISTVCLSGDSYPAAPIGINLPNADWIRAKHGSKSVTIENLTSAYDHSANEAPVSLNSEFSSSAEEIEMIKKYGYTTDNLHTDLHECLGHGSGRLMEGVPSNALKEFSSTIEEARADLFALYYLADAKLVELGLVPDAEAYKAEYVKYIRNGLLTQLVRIELGKQITEAHMQNRQMIAKWCFENGRGVIEKVVREGKTYFVIHDFTALRGLFAQLLAEIQRVKSEGDYEGAKALVNGYGTKVDYDLHKEVLDRYKSLGLKPYGGFVNPEISPVTGPDGRICDYRLTYCEDYLSQMLDYAERFATL